MSFGNLPFLFYAERDAPLRSNALTFLVEPNFSALATAMCKGVYP